MLINAKRVAKNSKKGFTLIELMLAVAFLGTLLLSVAMLAMRLVDMYTKGATMRAINSTGSAIVDDVRSSITSSGLWTNKLSDDMDPEHDGRKQYYRRHTYKVNKGTVEQEDYVDYGAFCTNSYTYVFNYQPAMLRYREGIDRFDEENSYLSIASKNASGTEISNRPYALARIKDPGCSQFKHLGLTTQAELDALLLDPTASDKPVIDTREFFQGKNHYFEVNEKELTVLLDGSQSDEGTDLQLYDFSVMSATQSRATNQALFNIAFVLGTTRGGIDVKSSNNYCKQQTKALDGLANAESYDNNAISYCSVNRFDFVVRQTGEKE